MQKGPATTPLGTSAGRLALASGANSLALDADRSELRDMRVLDDQAPCSIRSNRSTIFRSAARRISRSSSYSCGMEAK